MDKKFQVKSTKPNKYFEEYRLSDVDVVDDSKYVLAGSEKQFVHICTVTFKKETYVLFCEADWVVEKKNLPTLGKETYGWLHDTNMLKPKVYIEKVRYNQLPGRGDTIATYLEKVNDEDLFQFLLNYFQVTGILEDFMIKAAGMAVRNG